MRSSAYTATVGAQKMNDLALVKQINEALLDAEEQDVLEAMPKRLIDIDDIPDKPKFPIDALEQYDQQLADAIRYVAKAAQATIEMSAFSVLSGIAFVAQSHVNAPMPNGASSPCSLNLLVEGYSAERKSTVEELALKPLKRANYKLELERLDSIERRKRDKDEVLEDKTFLLDANSTIEAIGQHLGDGVDSALLRSDEAGAFFGGHSMNEDRLRATTSLLTKLFDSGSYSRKRAKSNQNANLSLAHKRLSCFLQAQPVVLLESLKNPLLQGQGYLARFLFCTNERLAGTRVHSIKTFRGIKEGESKLQWLHSKLEAALELPEPINEKGELLPNEASFESDEVLQLHIDYLNKVEAQQSKGDIYHDPNLSPFAGRSGELALRLATCLAYFRDPKPSVSIEAKDMSAALSIAEFSLKSWHLYYTNSKPSKRLIDAEILLKALINKSVFHGVFDKATIGKNAPNAFRRASEYKPLIDLLIAKGWIQQMGNKYQLSEYAFHAFHMFYSEE